MKEDHLEGWRRLAGAVLVRALKDARCDLGDIFQATGDSYVSSDEAVLRVLREDAREFLRHWDESPWAGLVDIPDIQERVTAMIPDD